MEEEECKSMCQKEAGGGERLRRVFVRDEDGLE